MRQTKPLAIFIFIFLFIGLGGLYRFSQHVRTVDAIGLFFSGAACGAALVCLVALLRLRAKV